MFLGTFKPKVLPKNQISLPAKIRAELKGNTVVLTVGFDQCLYGFSKSDWQKIVDQELLKPLLSTEGRRIRQQIFSQSEELDFDGQGRLVVPPYLRFYGQLENDITIIGAGDHFEIWNTQKWEQLKVTLQSQTNDQFS